MEYLLVEDECAPDGLEWFKRELVLKYGFTVEDFKTYGKRIEEEDKITYEYAGFILETFAEEQYWHFGIKE